MPALNFVIPAGWGTCTLCFEGSPASAHLWGRAGSSVLCCRPVTAPADVCHRWPGVSVWPSQQSLLGGIWAPITPHTNPCCSRSSWRGKVPPSHHWERVGVLKTTNTELQAHCSSKRNAKGNTKLQNHGSIPIFLLGNRRHPRGLLKPSLGLGLH